MIHRTNFKHVEITSADCDCCGRPIKKTGWQDSLEDHLIIGGYENGKLLEAIVCIPCMKEKFGFVKIQRKDNTIGWC